MYINKKRMLFLRSPCYAILKKFNKTFWASILGSI